MARPFPSASRTWRIRVKCRVCCAYKTPSEILLTELARAGHSGRLSSSRAVLTRPPGRARDLRRSRQSVTSVTFQNVRAFADRRGLLARHVSAGGNPAVAGWLELTPKKKSRLGRPVAKLKTAQSRRAGADVAGRLRQNLLSFPITKKIHRNTRH